MSPKAFLFTSRKAAFTLAESGQRPHCNPGFGRCAFTLAETLIALAVIGIVAALTIPGIVKNYNEHAWSTGKDVFSRKLDVALKEMNTEGTLTGYRTTVDFVNELKKNIKITRICTGNKLTNCFADKVVWSASDEPVEVNESNLKYNPMYGYNWAETVGIQFANGVNALIGYNKNCASDPYNNQYSPSASCIGIIYDVSGFKKPNSNGKDIASNGNLTLGCAFKFSYNGQSVCFTKILSKREYNPFPMTINGKTTYCSNLKGALGISDCYYGEPDGNPSKSDYWAGAAYACGRTAKMATKEQLLLLAKYLFETDEINDGDGKITDTSSYSSTFTKKLSSTPFYSFYNSYHYNYIVIWSGEEKSSTAAGNRHYNYSNTTQYYSFTRSNDFDRFAVCVE